VASYNRAVATCQKAGDNATADFFKEILKDEEGHVDFLETQLGLIKDLGLQNYLIEQMGEEKG
jgi:bacterioferritin